jgi:colanic acid biosynthesis protein WcaH
VIFIPEPAYQGILQVLPILCVDCVITFEGRCLLLSRNSEPAKGQRWLTGGRVHKNETLHAAALRKAYEEAGLPCQFRAVVSIEETMFPQVGDMASDLHTVNICCHLTASDLSTISIDSSHSDSRWVDKDEANSMTLHASVRAPLLACLTALESLDSREQGPAASYPRVANAGRAVN